jgi:hypothetical protein
MNILPPSSWLLFVLCCFSLLGSIHAANCTAGWFGPTCDYRMLAHTSTSTPPHPYLHTCTSTSTSPHPHLHTHASTHTYPHPHCHISTSISTSLQQTSNLLFPLSPPFPFPFPPFPVLSFYFHRILTKHNISW